MTAKKPPTSSTLEERTAFFRAAFIELAAKIGTKRVDAADAEIPFDARPRAAALFAEMREPTVGGQPPIDPSTLGIDDVLVKLRLAVRIANMGFKVAYVSTAHLDTVPEALAAASERAYEEFLAKEQAKKAQDQGGGR